MRFKAVGFQHGVSLLVEIDLWRRLECDTPFRRFKEFTLFKSKWSCNQNSRELLAACVILLNRIIIEPTRRRDLILHI